MKFPWATHLVVLSKEWIDPDRVGAILADLGLELNKEKTYVGTAGNGFEFVGFYFQEIVEENGAGSIIKIIPTEGSIEKIIESIESIESAICIENARFDNGYQAQALDNVIKNIYRVVNPWVNYYKHTEYAAGLERIEQNFNKKIKEFI
ncbi:MAG: hypothetical protein PHF18_16640 [Methanosarcina sp.]|uniref:hypothetical protein n=1 Tax=Methanosarcina sp. TaxID=2213 RepID=UPI002606DEA6|nr:hypothetical protein [Methanosarcina sp.]MDD3248459.1 hypothetical protein [Methanosarcina sp.]